MQSKLISKINEYIERINCGEVLSIRSILKEIIRLALEEAKEKPTANAKCPFWAGKVHGADLCSATSAVNKSAWCTDYPNCEKIEAMHTAPASLVEGVLEIVRTEPELPGEPSSETIKAMEDVGPIMNARIAVKTTKECIEERLKEYFSRYRPSTQADIVGELKLLRDAHMWSDDVQDSGRVAEREMAKKIEEIIRKYEEGK